MASLNKVFLMGNLTRDVQVRYTPGGTAVGEMGLAVNRSWFDKQANERKEEVTFVDVTLWGRTAEIAGEYLSKGKPVFIEGRLQLDSWDDKQTGQKRSKLRIVGEDMQFLGSGGGKQSGKSHDEQRQEQSGDGSQEPTSDTGSLPPYGSPPPSDEVPFAPCF